VLKDFCGTGRQEKSCTLDRLKNQPLILSFLHSLPNCWGKGHCPSTVSVSFGLWQCWFCNRKRIQPIKNLCHLSQRFSSKTSGGKKIRGTWKRPSKMEVVAVFVV